ncbi:response regulator transcription factor [Pontibacter burrus]|uniref:Response regulator transcription factor n=1 Tax=Pontibacter burrus TaxID=2704466 RepID=A0A6B3LNY5_9BACT|nr:response regulator transcription factor [Pontibacter burrus]NEM98509.1 response regulator transcription factor [Pontibacter burrus]
MSKDREALTLEFVIPWGQVWTPAVVEYQIKVELSGCRSLLCEYYLFKDDKANKLKPVALRETEKRITSAPLTMEKLGLEVQSYTFTQPDVYVLHCNSSREIAGGELTLTATDYRIFNNNGEVLSLDQLRQWATEWWDRIQEMWDEQKK